MDDVDVVVNGNIYFIDVIIKFFVKEYGGML